MEKRHDSHSTDLNDRVSNAINIEDPNFEHECDSNLKKQLNLMRSNQVKIPNKMLMFSFLQLPAKKSVHEIDQILIFQLHQKSSLDITFQTEICRPKQIAPS